MRLKTHVKVLGFVILGALILNNGSAQTLTIDPSDPPETLRGTVLRNGEIRTFNLERVSFRGEQFEVVLLAEDGVTQISIDPGPVRTYRGWCEQEPDSTVEATLLPNGDLRYHVFKGIYGTDWWYNPPYETNDTAGAVNNFTVIDGQPQQPSGQPYPGASFTEPAAALDDVFDTVYQKDIGFDVLAEYMNATHYSDLQSYVRKAENAVSHMNAFYPRDLLLEVELGKVVYRSSNEGVDRSSAQWGVDWWNVNDYFASLFPGVDHHFIAMVGSVGGGVAFVCDYGAQGWAGRTFNGWNGNDHNWWHVTRHEIGHNLGASDNPGGNPDGATFMSGNALTVSAASNPELTQIMNCRRSRRHLMRDIGRYDFPVPPYAQLSRFAVPALEESTLDVLANDFDANGDRIAIADFPETTSLGGTLSLSAGTGPNGRDQLLYRPAGNAFGQDRFEYTIVDQSGRTNQGRVILTVEIEQTLRGHWKLDETSGTTAHDATTNHHHGQLQGEGFSFENDSVSAVYDGGLRFNGQTDQIDVPAMNFQSNTVTLTGWVRPSSTQNNFTAIFSSRQGGAANFNYSGAGNNQLGYHWNDQYWNWNSGLSTPVNRWTFVAMVIEPTRATIYTYDGTTLRSAVNHAAHHPESFTGPMTIGRDRGQSNRHFNGAMDDLRVYSEALTESEIQDVIAGGRAESPSPFDGAREHSPILQLAWAAGSAAVASDVYLGTEYDRVANATPLSDVYLGRFAQSHHRPKILDRYTQYFWRVDQVDADGNVVAGQIWTFTTGISEGLLREVWLDISGDQVSALTGNPRYPANPDIVELVRTFEGPRNWNDAYGTRLHGFLIPPATGQYTFWIASDDNSELWLSPSTNPAHAIRIAHVTGSPAWTDYREWDKYASQKSNTVTLHAGRPYYIRALHKEGAGGDHLSVAWMGPNKSRQVIEGQYLIPYDPDIDWNPYFKKDPIVMDVLEGYEYSQDISDWAVGFDGYALTFMVIDGPDWLSLSSDGVLSGVARDADTGLDAMTIQARDAYFRTGRATVELKVWNTFTGEKGLDDLAGLTEFWLDSDCTDFPPCGGADLTGNKAVDLRDLSIMLSNWLLET